ncbi:hypothetical protein D7D82_25700 [Escherichia coli]|nr:hypothetical protein [Escherichia coli]EFN9310842.1 hypothetical protein [Escherichia coli]EFO0620404.1 hypothetical protein [Escherichia coli]EFO1669671.1 hypothetical protein [Escherichia coli]PIM05687.1 hypothetical protein CT145_27295 [Escherichia coli]
MERRTAIRESRLLPVICIIHKHHLKFLTSKSITLLETAKVQAYLSVSVKTSESNVPMGKTITFIVNNLYHPQKAAKRCAG